MSEPERPEFDAWAQGYDGGMEHPLKRMAGGGHADYIRLKAGWLMERLGESKAGAGAAAGDPCLIDYGCGNGILLRELRAPGLPWRLAGCDLSTEMLREAAEAWVGEQPPNWVAVEEGRVPFEDGAFDAVVVSGVLHHVPPVDRPGVVAECARLLAPGGCLVVFEHNPFNPVTQLVVRTTAIDRDAALISAPSVRKLMGQAGLRAARTDHILFFPPRLTWLRFLERRLRRVPMGGQYAVLGRSMFAPAESA